ncbi:glycosyltransferase [Treponema saccharophilum]|uniref:Glycosyl transferase family 2 n=1 Tax=Treponema saccharophilum DSM 2985 TaxID=907348 RepID=H7EI38_9SPIR|nr:glycosyltransferase [Treponema saccharophilum]EIC02717.1 glycosyl transferase family 2 [Treponema saccharophilum DSM 2985]BDC96129.1 hypothetical protein TRSA_12280 [Treponema saccharophilum]
MRNGIDIIIPIYNAYEDLCKCLESIELHTDLTLDRLILINDKSPDERILPLLKEKERENVIVIDNENNLGFSGNVNKGMCFSDDRDVILLNSDTIVTKNWVDRIYECAYSKKEIGTVTPLSNAATLCSIPVMCKDNKLPEGLTADDMAEIVEQCSIKAYPRISVAVGFCMFIKREVIKVTGLFDAKTFEKGYGEENDFCNRAEQLGYIHVMCDSAFVYHKGTASFKNEEKAKLCADHEKLLNSWYPMQMRFNHLYCVNNPEQYIRDNIEPFIDLHNGKKNVLYLVHLDFRSDSYGNVGGTQFHVRDLTENLKTDFNVFVVSRDREYIRLSIYIGEKIHSYKFYVGSPSLFFIPRNEQLYKLFSSILDEFKISLVHVHHVDTLSLDIYYAAHERNLPLVHTVHDFYPISPGYKLLDDEGNWLADEKPDSEKWLLGAKKQSGYRPIGNIIKVWRNNFEEALSLCDKIFLPSEFAKETLCAYFPTLAQKSEVIYHGKTISKNEPIRIHENEISFTDKIHFSIDSVEMKSSIAVVNGWIFLEGADSRETEIFIETVSDSGAKLFTSVPAVSRVDVAQAFQNEAYASCGFCAKVFLPKTACLNSTHRIAIRYNGKVYSETSCCVNLTWNRLKKTRKRISFIGGMVPEKGSQLIYDIIKSGKGDNYDWYLIGACGDETLSRLVAPNFHKVGYYTESELPSIFKSAQIDIVCILSIWGETFCYTLSEAVMCGLPVLGIDIGAVGERIKQNGYGWVVPYPASSKDIVEKLDEIFSDNSSYNFVAEKANKWHEKSSFEMSQEYAFLYNSLTKAFAPKYQAYDSRLILSGLVKNSIFAYSENVPSWFDFDKYVDVIRLKDEHKKMLPETEVQSENSFEEQKSICTETNQISVIDSYPKHLSRCVGLQKLKNAVSLYRAGGIKAVIVKILHKK